MKDIYDVIARRSLNYSKNANSVMYLSIRCFFESFSSESRKDNSFKEFIERKLYVRNHWSTKRCKLFKEKDGDEFIYRDTLTLSPFGIVAESYLMMKIAESKKIKNKPYVYSYLLPKVDSSRNFQYYFDGYKRRNENITVQLKDNTDDVAVVLDLEKFYPSIDNVKAKEIFLNALGKESNSEISKLSEKMTNSIIEQSIKGVPIGLNLNHLIAQTYLSKFDKHLNDMYPNRYFRYVDDIVIIAHESEEENVKKFVSSQLLELSEKLKINNSKTSVINAQDWALLNSKSEPQNESLHDLLHFITAYLAMHPSRIDNLSKSISKAGYSIPLKRLKKQSTNNMFMLFVNGVMKKNKKFNRLKIYFTEPDVIVGKLLALKNFYKANFIKLTKLMYDDSNSAENRSNTQQLKYVINRLLYLSTIDELADFHKMIPDTEKFQDTKEVIYALYSKDLKMAIQYGGKVVQTVSELWIENEFDSVVLSGDDLKEVVNIDDVLDSILTLFLHKVITFEIENILPLLNEFNQEYLQVVLDSSYEVQNRDYEFLLEIQGLLKGKDLDSKFDLLTSRYDDDEEIQLAGLNLGLGYSL